MDAILNSLIGWLQAQSFQQAIAGTFWVVPAVQTVHILCVAIVMSAALVVALRGLELAGGDWSLARWQARFRMSTIVALWTLLATGIVMTIAEPERELLNWIFRTKMLLVILTIIATTLLGRSLRRAPVDQSPSAGVRIGALVVLLGWVGIAVCGRWIAYAG